MAGQPVVRVKWQMMIHTVVQVFLILLFLLMVWHFQKVFVAKGEPQVFYNSIYFTLILQAALFYPIYRLASFEAKNEIAAQSTTAPDELQALRKRRISGDLLKAAVFIFYATFLAMTPPATFVLSTTFFSFVATSLTYLQSFNFCAKRIMAGENPSLSLGRLRK